VPTRLLPTLIAAVLIAAGLAACGSQSPAAKSPSATASAAPSSWVDDAVSFPVGGMTVYGTFRHPAERSRPVPGALLIAGSGPTDRDGNSTVLPGPMDTLKNLAQILSNDGVATLRYDKLGTGQTGAGPYAIQPAKLDLAVFQDEATAALNFLAGQSGIDRSHLMVVGHSEGALYALQLATAPPGNTPPVHALALVEPQSRRILDHVSEQIHRQFDEAVKAGQFTSEQAAQQTAEIDNAIQEFRATGKVPPDEPPALKPIISPADARLLQQEDAVDPAELAAKLPRAMPVLITCSDADTQITCEDVDRLVSGLNNAGIKVDFVHLTGVNHVLKEDASKTPAGYTEPLPFSTQLTGALASFVKENLTKT
jgi:uncharacterized protein